MPSKRVIILELQGNRIRYALWADVPATRQVFYAGADKTSAWKDIAQAELDALKSGAVVERVDVLQKDGLNNAQARTELENIWIAFQAEINAFNPWNRYGSFLSSDGTTWTAAGVS